MHPPEPREAKLAAKAWAAGEYDVGRTFYRKAIELAKTNAGTLPPSFYLSEWARMEGTISNRDAFEGWLRTTWLPYIQQVPEKRRQDFVKQVAEAYLEENPPSTDGVVHLQMVRLEVESKKE